MARWKIFTALIPVMLFSFACTNRNPKTDAEVVVRTAGTVTAGGWGIPSTGGLEAVSLYTNLSAGGDTELDIMGFINQTAFGYVRWNVTNPDLPQQIGPTSAENWSAFSPIGGWTVAKFGQAVASVGNVVLSSGSVGTSVISRQNIYQPVEVKRYPMPDVYGTMVPDATRIYSAIAVHPTLNINFGSATTVFYGGAPYDYLYLLDMDSSGNVSIRARYAYTTTSGNADMAFFNGRLYMAMTTRLAAFNMNADGTPASYGEDSTMKAVGLASDGQYLYVQHRNDGTANSLATGIYRLNSSLQRVKYWSYNPRKFKVANNRIYYNDDNNLIKVRNLD